MEWITSMVRLPEEEGNVYAERKVELLEEATNTLSKHIHETVDLFVEKLKSEKQITNTDNTKLTKYDLYYLLTTYPELLQSDFTDNMRDRNVKTDEEIALLLFKRYYPSEDVNNTVTIDKTYLLNLISKQKAKISQIFTLESIVEAELKKLSEITSKQLSVKDFNGAVSTAMNNIEKVINMYRHIPEHGNLELYTEFLDYLIMVEHVIPMLNNMPKRINNINNINAKDQWPKINALVSKFDEQKNETFSDAVKQMKTVSDKISSIIETFKKSGKTKIKTYTNESNIQKAREQARAARQKEKNNAAARIKAEHEEQERREAEQKREKEARNAEIAKTKANRNEEEQARRAKLKEKELLHFENEREKRATAYKAYGLSAEERAEQKAAEEAAREAKEKQLAEAKGKTLKERIAALQTHESGTKGKQTLPHLTPVITENLSELLKLFLAWLSNQKELLNRVLENEKLKFKTFIAETLYSNVVAKTRFTVEQKKENDYLSKIKSFVENEGIDELINGWISGLEGHGITDKEKENLKKIISTSILVMTVRGGGAKKTLTKRRKLSKRLQTKKRRV